jgi:hypothetical protein
MILLLYSAPEKPLSGSTSRLPINHHPEGRLMVRGAELAHLGVNALAVGRNPCVAVFHAKILLLYSAPEKPFFIKGLFHVQQF